MAQQTELFILRKALLGACTMSAMVLSFIFTVSFWGAMGATLVAKYLLSATGCVFEVSKFYALPTFIEFKKQNAWGRAIGCLGIFLVLSLISMLAGIYALNSNLNLNAQNSMQENTIYQSQIHTISIQDQKIQQMMKLAQQDADAGYRKRAKETLLAVDSEQVYLNQLKAELVHTNEQVITPQLQIPFITTQISNWLVMILGALLEITTTFLIVLFRNYRNTSASTSKANRCSKLVDIATNNKSKVKNVDQNVFNPNDKYREVVQKITSKVWEPTQRTLKRAANIGSNTASSFLKKMQEEGHLLKHQGKYVLK